MAREHAGLAVTTMKKITGRYDETSYHGHAIDIEGKQLESEDWGNTEV